MKKILIILIILGIPLTGNCFEKSSELDKSIPLDASETFEDFDSFEIENDVVTTQPNHSNICSFKEKVLNVCVVGGTILGALIMALSTTREPECDLSRDRNTLRDDCSLFPNVDYYASMAGRVLIGGSIGFLVGAGLTFATDSNNKNVLISTKFRF